MGCSRCFKRLSVFTFSTSDTSFILKSSARWILQTIKGRLVAAFCSHCAPVWSNLLLEVFLRFKWMRGICDTCQMVAQPNLDEARTSCCTQTHRRSRGIYSQRGTRRKLASSSCHVFRHRPLHIFVLFIEIHAPQWLVCHRLEDLCDGLLRLCAHVLWVFAGGITQLWSSLST